MTTTAAADPIPQPGNMSCPEWPCPEYTITGSVYGSDTEGQPIPLEYVHVRLVLLKGAGGSDGYTTTTDANGAFTHIQVNPGVYTLYFDTVSFRYLDLELVNHGSAFLGGAVTQDEAATITVTTGGVSIGDVDLPRSGTISGTVTGELGSDPIFVSSTIVDPVTGRLAATMTTEVQPDGTYSLEGVSPGAHVVRAWGAGIESVASSGAGSVADAVPVEVAPDSSVSSLTIAVESGGVEVERLAGVDRYATAVEISRYGFPDVPSGGVPVVFVVSGTNFPDALSAGPAAARLGGPVLLTTPASLPTVVRDEIIRLEPQRIIIVGGTPSVSDGVRAALDAIGPAPQRWAGADRYQTSYIVARNAFPEATNAYIVTGANFPDALSAGAPAGWLSAPILLSPPALSDTTALLKVVEDLGIQNTTFVGGWTTIDRATQSDFDFAEPSLRSVTRIAGADRFDTSRQLAGANTISDRVFLANGATFPDALAGSWLAAVGGGPLYLVQQHCIPADTLGWIFVHQPHEIVLLGGTPTLGSGVFELTACP